MNGNQCVHARACMCVCVCVCVSMPLCVSVTVTVSVSVSVSACALNLQSFSPTAWLPLPPPPPPATVPASFLLLPFATTVQEKLLEIAKKSGAQAIHPGYGFLSENVHFATACEKEGVTFIGPPASAIDSMGSKSASKNIMLGSGVPCVPGYHGEDQSFETLQAEADKIGYPLMIKAVLGGGGKGMRIVFKREEFDENLQAAIRESKNSFDDDRVLLERYIQRPRHIEFQVFADTHGNVVHLFERDCSVQRRHQKVLEEAPAPGMTPELRAKMGQSAVDAAKAVGYVGAGTVEFIFDAETEEYFFMEMNTRLQVEHPVTEMVVRKDLVQWQLHVAAGHQLPVEQEQITSSGHSLEARIYAEDPDNNFLPCTGHLAHLRPPSVGSAGDIRVETGVRQGDDVSIYYDPMISKLIVWANDRDRCLRMMSRALADYEIVGLPTNIPFLQRAVAHPAFEQGQVETGFIADNMEALLPKQTEITARALCLATLAQLIRERGTVACATRGTNDPYSPWADTSSARVNMPATRSVTLISSHHGGEDGTEVIDVRHELTATSNEDGSYTFVVTEGDQKVTLQATGELVEKSRLHARIGGEAVEASVVEDGAELHVFVNDVHTKLRVPEVNFAAKAHDQGAVSPMAGKVVKVMVEAGETVTKGQNLMIMEAMKMEHVIRAPRDGVVEAVLLKDGDFVEGNKLLVSFVEEDDE
jgi:3-methylcrotonyl-CoA carboxylase alpha subunit